MDIGGFIGRFHPLFVHLPIGFLILAGLFEYYARKPKYTKLNGAVSFTLFAGALFAILSCASGWLLANRGAYIERSLFLHRWLGIAVAIIATLCWLIKSKRWQGGSKALGTLIAIMTLGVFATGHFGGNMTHGEDYLIEYAPQGVKNILGFGKDEVTEYDFGSLDSIGLYGDLLMPVFEERCWKCHRPENALGGLDMTTKAALLKGGTHGDALKPGKAFESLIFERIILPVSDRESMPPVGLALPFDQVRLIEWWINSGASFEKKLSAYEVPADIKDWLEQKYEISFRTKSLVESIEVGAADLEELNTLRDQGIEVNNLAENSNLLEVKLPMKTDLAPLLKIKDQITWLDLSKTDIDDDDLILVAQLKNITRLRLQNTKVTNKGIQNLTDLPLLESLNLNGTVITDDALPEIGKMLNLKSVYLFETKVTTEGVEELKKQNSTLEVVRGFQFEKQDTK